MLRTDAEVPRLWTHRETAAFLSISETQLYILNRQGAGPPSYKVGGLRRYSPDDVRGWLSGQVDKREAAA